jgi:hypothetical protein
MRIASACLLDNVEMVDYRQNQHSVWDIQYHMISVTKYRYKVLLGEIAV